MIGTSKFLAPNVIRKVFSIVDSLCYQYCIIPLKSTNPSRFPLVVLLLEVVVIQLGSKLE